jgi:hypothetical protein
MFTENKLSVVKKGGHKEIEQIATGRLEHLVHPLGRDKQKVYTLIPYILHRAASFLANDLNRFL